ncbi:unnamed protein product, partial [marine sediment metagenome]
AFRGVSSPLERAPAEPTIPPVVTPEIVEDPLAGADTTGVIPPVETEVETEVETKVPPVETKVPPVGTGGTQEPYSPEDILKIRELTKRPFIDSESILNIVSESEDGNSFTVEEKIEVAEGKPPRSNKVEYVWNNNDLKWSVKTKTEIKPAPPALADPTSIEGPTGLTAEQKAEELGYEYLPESNQAYDPETDEIFDWIEDPTFGPTWGKITPKEKETIDYLAENNVEGGKVNRLTRVVDTTDLAVDSTGNYYLWEKGPSGSNEWVKGINDTTESATASLTKKQEEQVDSINSKGFTGGVIRGLVAKIAAKKAAKKPAAEETVKATPEVKAKPLPKNTKPEVAWATFNKEIPYKELDKELQSRIKDALADNYFDATLVKDIADSHRKNKIAEKNKSRVVTKDSVMEDSTRGQVGTPATKGRVNTFSSTQELLE